MFVSLFVCLFCCVLRAAEIRFLLRRTAQLAIPHIQIQITLQFAANFSQTAFPFAVTRSSSIQDIIQWIILCRTFVTESTHKGVNQHPKDVIQTQQQRPESPTVTLTWNASKHKVRKFHQMYLVFTRMSG